MKSVYLLFIVYFGTQLTPSQFQASDCITRTKCGECIQRAGCAWCSKTDYLKKGASYRCNIPENIKDCESNMISNPKNRVDREQDRPVGQGIQVQPQRVKLYLRPGEPAKLEVVVRPAKDYPVDLYYLMDMSWSMRDDLANLKSLGGKIAQSMKNITKIFKLGFGSFVDKTVSPYVRTEQVKPCEENEHCIPYYGYRHILSLNADGKLFENQVKAQNISGNLDTPEGGFDALMQVAACENTIGWSPKDKSRRLVIFVTDAPFHVAGDGKLGGIVLPNDLKCHLSRKGNYDEYVKSNELDYPTIAQLHEKLKESQIQPIFAVTGNVTNLYDSVSDTWTDLGAVTGKLASDSGNIVALIEESYSKIVSTVRFAHNASNDVSLDYQAQCVKGQVDKRKTCTGVQLGQKVHFDVSFTLRECPKDLNQKLSPFVIRIPGFGKVNVELEHICECDCAKGDAPVQNSTYCSNGNGTYSCGTCDCNEGRYGKICECDSPFDHQSDSSKCKGNSTDEVVCSGRGQCICGKCECRKVNQGVIFGDLCQCDDFNCPQSNRKPCGGPSQGKCNCGKCQCLGVYVGVNCGQKNCSLLDEQCQKPDSQQICSGPERGKCECGVCKCSAKYTGDFCQECPGCDGGICALNKDCVVCTAGFNKRSLDDCKNSNRCEANVIEVSNVNDITVKTSKGLFRCDHKDANDCLYLYTYERLSDDPKKYNLFIEKRCPEEPNILAIVLGVIGGIVGIGLILLLIWKLLIMMADRVEYQKFEKERARAKWKKEDNPLYKGAKTTFQNPTYAGGS